MTTARRARPAHADTYTPRAMPGSVSVPTDAPPAAPAAPAPDRRAYHRRDAVPGTVGAAARVRVSPAAPAPRLAPMRDVVPLRTTEHASRATHGVGHVYVTGRDGFVTTARDYRGATTPLPTAARIPVTHADGTVTTARVSDAPAPDAYVSPVRAASAYGVTIGAADLRDACDTDASTGRMIDGNGRIVRTTADADTWRAPYRRPAARRAPAAPARVADGPERNAPPARVSRDVVTMWIRASGYAGPVDARMIALARDAMAAQRQRDAYTDAD